MLFAVGVPPRLQLYCVVVFSVQRLPVLTPPFGNNLGRTDVLFPCRLTLNYIQTAGVFHPAPLVADTRSDAQWGFLSVFVRRQLELLVVHGLQHLHTGERIRDFK